MVKKLDIMNMRDPVEPGEVCKWQIEKGKVQKIVDDTPKEEIQVVPKGTPVDLTKEETKPVIKKEELIKKIRKKRQKKR